MGQNETLSTPHSVHRCAQNRGGAIMSENQNTRSGPTKVDAEMKLREAQSLVWLNCFIFLAGICRLGFGCSKLINATLENQFVSNALAGPFVTD